MPGLRPLVTHAMRTVAAGRRRLFAGVLEPLRQKYGAAALVRVENLDAFADGPVAGLSELYREAGPQVRFLAVTGVFDAEVARGRFGRVGVPG